MIVADKMQKSMHEKMRDVIAQGFSRLEGFPRGGLECDHDVAEKRRNGGSPPAGKESTLVGSSRPRHLRLSSRMNASSQRTMLISALGGEHGAAFADRREDRCLGKFEWRVERRPILSFDRDIDHRIHFRASWPEVFRAGAAS